MTVAERMLVLGSRGFIGSAVARLASERGWQTATVDRHINRRSEQVPNAVRSLEPDAFFARIAEAVQSFQPTTLIHAAGPASVAASFLDPLEDFRGSVELTSRVLEHCRRFAPTCRVILLSSAAVYGSPKELPITELAATNPVSPYGYHKLLCERLLREYVEIFEVPACAVRVFSAYGSGLQRQILWDACLKLSTTPRADFWGTGAETRDFVHVRDVAAGIELLARSAPCSGEVYNLGSGEATPIRLVVQQLRLALGKEVSVHFNQHQRSGDPLHWQADITRIRSLGFQPSVPLQEGLRQYAAWFACNNPSRGRPEQCE